MTTPWWSILFSANFRAQVQTRCWCWVPTNVLKENSRFPCSGASNRTRKCPKHWSMSRWNRQNSRRQWWNDESLCRAGDIERIQRHHQSNVNFEWTSQVTISHFCLFFVLVKVNQKCFVILSSEVQPTVRACTTQNSVLRSTKLSNSKRKCCENTSWWSRITGKTSSNLTRTIDFSRWRRIFGFISLQSRRSFLSASKRFRRKPPYSEAQASKPWTSPCQSQPESLQEKKNFFYLQFNFISEITLNPEAHVTEPGHLPSNDPKKSFKVHISSCCFKNKLKVEMDAKI